jgi:hypothetical protein
MQLHHYYILTIQLDRVKNEILHTANEEKNILHIIIRRKDNGIGHNLRTNCLLKHVIEGMI